LSEAAIYLLIFLYGFKPLNLLVKYLPEETVGVMHMPYSNHDFF